MRVVVPFDARDAKSRLDPFLSPSERSAFAEAMLRDVLSAVLAAGGDPELLATATVDLDGPDDTAPSQGAAPSLSDVPVTVDERSLDAAVNDALAAAGPDAPVAVVMADLALATPRSLARLFGADGDVVVAPGRGGGTNALVVRHPDFRVDYHGASYLDHLRNAAAVGASVRELDSMRLATDVDERADLPELLLHGDGAAVAWLREHGVELDVADGRVGVRQVD
ncbi:MAG: 2-phospho-L-lactate guanylyltransferase [Haloferacaceae archaeon]